MAQSYDYKFIYNLSMYYAELFFKGQKGVLGHILGGWTISPLFTALSGAPASASYSDYESCACDAFGSVGDAGTSLFGASGQHAVGFTPYTGGTSVHYGITGDNGTNIVEGTAAIAEKVNGSYGSPLGLNMFTNPGQIFSEFRPCVLGYDTSCGGGANLRGLPTWNLDTTVVKGYRYLQRTCGRHAVLYVHERPESLPGEHSQVQPHQPDDVWSDHRPSQHAAEHGVRT
jgi:hypothetical protein